MSVDREILTRFLNQKVELVKDNDFVEYGKIVEIYEGCIGFYISKSEKTIFISFDRIAEIRPARGRDFDY